MFLISRCIFAYALALIAPEVLDLTRLVSSQVVPSARLSGWIGGSIMLAAGFAAAQRRRALRLGGTIAALFVALALCGIYTWAAAQIWSVERRSTTQGWVLSVLAVFSIALVWVIFRLRPRDGIATRGYAVILPTSRR